MALGIWTIVFTIVAFGALNSAQIPEELKLIVMTSGGLTAASHTLFPAFERKADCKIVAVYGASMGAIPDAIPNRLQRGESADVVVLASEVLSKLVEQGKVVESSRVDLAESVIGMAVRAGAPKPEIKSVEQLKQALIDAKSVAYSGSASGVYLTTQLFPRLGIADQIKSKSRRVEGEMVGAVIARGEAEVGFQQMSELMPIQGIDIVGPLPSEAQKITVYSGGIIVGSEHPQLAAQFLRFLASPQAAQDIQNSGLRPISSKR
jgi:molybdate transport system substrate-binding protein